MGGIVVGAKLRGTVGLCVRVILACHVVGYEIDDDFQPAAVGTLHQILKFLHASGYVFGQVGIYVIVIFDGIRRTGLSLDDSRMVGTYVVAAIIALCGMFNNTGVPNVSGSQPFDFTQSLAGEVGHLATAVFGQISVVDAMVIVVSEESGEYLVNDEFVVVVVHILYNIRSRLWLWCLFRFPDASLFLQQTGQGVAGGIIAVHENLIRFFQFTVVVIGQIGRLDEQVGFFAFGEGV